MDLSDLSSNWKRLQQSLKSDKKPAPGAEKAAKGQSSGSSSGKKRKAGATTAAGSDKGAPLKLPSIKKRKTSSHSQQSVTNGHGPGSKPQPASKQAHHQSKPSKTSTTTPRPNSKNARKSKMGVLSSVLGAAGSVPRLPSTAADSDLDDDQDEDAVPRSTAIEDIPYSQRALASQPSLGIRTTGSGQTSLVSPSDQINSGLVESVKVGRYVALDCEMVGVGPDPSARSMLARVSLVNFHGEQVYDSFVVPKEAVTDYRTAVSGITERLLNNGARSFETVQAEVATLLDGRILVGHAVRHDLDALMLGHPKRDIRDTSHHKPYREYAGGRTPALKKLAREILGVDIQGGAHSSVEDARATMMLYRREKNAFEKERVQRYGVDRRKSGPAAIEGEVVAVREKAGDDVDGNAPSRGGKNKKKKKKKAKR